MQARLDQLDLILANQIAGLTALRNWLPRKIELVRKNRVAELESLNQREEELVQKLQQAESQREVLMGLIAMEVGAPAAPATVSELAGLLPENSAARFRERARQLGDVVRQLQEGQARLRELLRVSLEYTHYSMDIFAELATAAPPSGYGDDGEIRESQVGSWLVNRQA